LRLAVFDLDGTLTREDTYRQYVIRLLLEHPARWPRVVGLPLLLLGYVFGILDRGSVKGAILRLLFSGMSRATIAEFNARFAASVVQNGMFAEALAAFRGHLAAGDHVVVLSASPDLYVTDIGRLLGAHETISTAIRWHGDLLDGRLAGPNRRDHEKARVLATLRAAHPGLPVIAYGNSAPDLVHMALCEESVFVNAGGKLAAIMSTRWPNMRPVRWR
jgi:phosphatidylglycerophosphatase C